MGSAYPKNIEAVSQGVSHQGCLPLPLCEARCKCNDNRTELQMEFSFWAGCEVKGQGKFLQDVNVNVTVNRAFHPASYSYSITAPSSVTNIGTEHNPVAQLRFGIHYRAVYAEGANKT